MLDYNNNFKDLITKYPDLWKNKQLKIGKTLLEAGEFANKNFYVESGIIRSYYQSEKKDKEIIIGFFSEDDSITFHRSFIEPIMLYLDFEVIEDASVWIINDEDWNKIEAQEPKLHELMHKEHDKVIRRLVEYSIIRNESDALERYNIFMRSRPYASRLKIEHIAMYIGVLPSTLSALRSKT